MKNLAIFALIFLSQALCSCGVKGVPQAPTTAPVLGRGEPNFSKATENLKIKKPRPRTNDWNETNDFSEEKEK